MKKRITGLMIVIAVTILASSAFASNVGFSFAINVGATPVYAPQPVVIDEPPEFVAPPALGFYAAVNTPYDLFYVADRYYVCRDNAWYSAPYYNGPWVQVGYRALPWSLRRYPIARIRYMRDERDDTYYGYRHFRPEWNNWHDGHARWEGERPYGSRHYRAARHWDEDDDD